MAKAAKGLKTLIRLARFNVDEKRRVLTALQNREDRILADIANGEKQLKVEQDLAASDATGAGFLYGAYQQAWMQRREDMQAALAQVRQQIDEARDELADAYRELKTFEVTQANREKRDRQEADRKEQIFLDEVAQTQHRLKTGPSDEET